MGVWKDGRIANEVKTWTKGDLAKTCVKDTTGVESALNRYPQTGHCAESTVNL
jgi:hypothetical protein